MTTNVSVTITGTYPSYNVSFSDGGSELVPFGSTANILYGFAVGTVGFTFQNVVDVVKTPPTTKDSISWKVNPSQLTVTAVNSDKSASVIGYRIEFKDSHGRVFVSSDPQVECEGEPE